MPSSSSSSHSSRSIDASVHRDKRSSKNVSQKESGNGIACDNSTIQNKGLSQKTLKRASFHTHERSIPQAACTEDPLDVIYNSGLSDQEDYIFIPIDSGVADMPATTPKPGNGADSSAYSKQLKKKTSFKSLFTKGKGQRDKIATDSREEYMRLPTTGTHKDIPPSESLHHNAEYRLPMLQLDQPLISASASVMPIAAGKPSMVITDISHASSTGRPTKSPQIPQDVFDKFDPPPKVPSKSLQPSPQKSVPPKSDSKQIRTNATAQKVVLSSPNFVPQTSNFPSPLSTPPTPAVNKGTASGYSALAAFYGKGSAKLACPEANAVPAKFDEAVPMPCADSRKEEDEAAAMTSSRSRERPPSMMLGGARPKSIIALEDMIAAASPTKDNAEDSQHTNASHTSPVTADQISTYKNVGTYDSPCAEEKTSINKQLPRRIYPKYSPVSPDQRSQHLSEGTTLNKTHTGKDGAGSSDSRNRLQSAATITEKNCSKEGTSPFLRVQQPSPAPERTEFNLHSPQPEDPERSLQASHSSSTADRPQSQNLSDLSDSQFMQSPTLSSSVSGVSTRPSSSHSSVTSAGDHIPFGCSEKDRSRKPQPISSAECPIASALSEDASADRINLSTFEKHAPVLISLLVRHCEWQTIVGLRSVSQTLRDTVDLPVIKEKVLQRHLSIYGYSTAEALRRASIALPRNALPNVIDSQLVQFYVDKGQIDLSYRDLGGFAIYNSIDSADFARYAKEYRKGRLSHKNVRLIQYACRSYSRILARIRSQPSLHANATLPIYRPGRTISLRVWVPCESAWMSDEELIDCERELFRAGLWEFVKRGDCVHNCALGDFANEGKVLSDGRFLRDLSFSYDAVGHLPGWLNAMAFSPSHFHSTIASSTEEGPIVYLDLTPFHAQIQATLTLLQDKVQLHSPSGKHWLNRYVYRSLINLEEGSIIGSNGGSSGNGPGGLETIHCDWHGQLVVETEGTAESAARLVKMSTPAKYTSRVARNQEATTLHPFRILRQRSRLHCIVVRPCLSSERVL